MKLLRVEEVAVALGRSFQAVRNAISTGELAVVRVGARGIRVREDEVAKLARGGGGKKDATGKAPVGIKRVSEGIDTSPDTEWPVLELAGGGEHLMWPASLMLLADVLESVSKRFVRYGELDESDGDGVLAWIEELRRILLDGSVPAKFSLDSLPVATEAVLRGLGTHQYAIIDDLLARAAKYEAEPVTSETKYGVDNVSDALILWGDAMARAQLASSRNDASSEESRQELGNAGIAAS